MQKDYRFLFFNKYKYYADSIYVLQDYFLAKKNGQVERIKRLKTVLEKLGVSREMATFTQEEMKNVYRGDTYFSEARLRYNITLNKIFPLYGEVNLFAPQTYFLTNKKLIFSEPETDEKRVIFNCFPKNNWLKVWREHEAFNLLGNSERIFQTPGIIKNYLDL